MCVLCISPGLVQYCTEYVFSVSVQAWYSILQNVCALYQSRLGPADCAVCLSFRHNGSLITYTAICLTALTIKHHTCCGAWFCGCWFAEVIGSNPAVGMEVGPFRVLCVVR